MEQRDYVQKQIEQLGLLFEALAARISQIPQSNRGATIQPVLNNLQKEAGFTVEDVIELHHENLDLFIQQHLHNNLTLTERLAYLVEQVARHNEQNIPGQRQAYIYKSALQLLEHVNRNSDVFSFERSAKIEQLKKISLHTPNTQNPNH